MNKTDCRYFNCVGNICSRVDGMARCDEYPECEFKYIDALKEENEKLKEELAEANQLKDMYHTYYRAKHDDIKGIIFKQKQIIGEIKIICKKYSENCKIEGNCIDNRLCSTCFFGGAIELIDELNGVLKDE